MGPSVVENPTFIQVMRGSPEAVLVRFWSNQPPTLEFFDGESLRPETELVWPDTSDYELDLEHLKGQIMSRDIEVQWIFVIPDEVQ